MANNRRMLMSVETIHIYLPEEAVDVWRPIAAEHLGGDLYRILDEPPSGEVWQFNRGDIVRCSLRRLSGDFGRVTDCLVALEKSN
jgi:hypothetical protein